MAYYSCSSTSQTPYIYFFPVYLISLSEGQSPSTFDQGEGRFKDIATYTVARDHTFRRGGGERKIYTYFSFFMSNIQYFVCKLLHCLQFHIRITGRYGPPKFHVAQVIKSLKLALLKWKHFWLVFWMDPVRTSAGTVTMLTIFEFYFSPFCKSVGY
jgi:hypothetical protein